MSLVWHIVRKDLRRLAGPLSLWLLLVLGHVGLLFVWDGLSDTDPAAVEGKRYFVNTCGAIVRTIGFLLAAWLVMEDSLVSTRAFWQTRPIHGIRLLAAKVLGAVLMFGVLPVVALIPVWLGCGFSAGEIVYAATDFALVQALCSLAAFALASVTETSGQFLVRLIGGAICLPVLATYVLGKFPGSDAVSSSVAVTRSLIVIGLLGLTPMAMIAHQFFTRRTARSWLVLAMGASLMIVVGRWWPWSFFSGLPEVARVAATVSPEPVVTADRLTVERLSSLGNWVPMALEGRVTGIASGTHIRVDFVKGWWLDEKGSRPGPHFAGLAANGRPDGRVVRRVAGLEDTFDGEVFWGARGGETGELLKQLGAHMLGPRNPVKEQGASSGRLRGVVGATVLHGAVLGELPLRAGATLKVGSSMTRIKSLKWTDGNLVMLIEERDAWTRTAGIYSGSYSPRDRRIRPVEDGFVVFNRHTGFDQVPTTQEIGTLTVDSIVVGRRNLVIAPPTQDDWLAGAVIVKVRFRPGEKITLPLSGEPKL